MNPTSGSLKRELIERVYIPKGPPNPKFHTLSIMFMMEILILTVAPLQSLLNF